LTRVFIGQFVIRIGHKAYWIGRPFLAKIVAFQKKGHFGEMKFGKWTCYESFNEMFVIMRCFKPMPSFGKFFDKGTRGLRNPAEARGAYGTRQRHAGPMEPGRGIKSLVLNKHDDFSSMKEMRNEVLDYP